MLLLFRDRDTDTSSPAWFKLSDDTAKALSNDDDAKPNFAVFANPPPLPTPPPPPTLTPPLSDVTTAVLELPSLASAVENSRARLLKSNLSTWWFTKLALTNVESAPEPNTCTLSLLLPWLRVRLGLVSGPSMSNGRNIPDEPSTLDERGEMRGGGWLLDKASFWRDDDNDDDDKDAGR
jgi:hypothetical protein